MLNFKIFQKHINTAINSYLQTCKNNGKSISQRRRNDIANIKKIISGNYIDYKQSKKSVTYYIKNMRTGWFFPTGRSDLKNSIESEMQKFKKNESHVLLTPTGKVQFINSFEKIKPITIHVDEYGEDFKTKNRICKNENQNNENNLPFSFVR